MNQVTLLGNLTKDFEERYINDKKVYSSTLAVKRNYGDKTDFINITIWGDTGERTAQYNGKGAKLLVTGELNIDKVDDKYYTKVNVKTVEYLTPRQQDRTDLMGAPFVDREVPKTRSKEFPAYDFEAEKEHIKKMKKELDENDLPF